MFMRDGLHLSRKGATVLAEGLSGAADHGSGKVGQGVCRKSL